MAAHMPPPHLPRGRGGLFHGGIRKPQQDLPPVSLGMPVSEGHKYMVPKKEIHDIGDMEKWQRSHAFQEYLGFVLALNEAAKGKSCLDEYPVSDCTKAVISLLDCIQGWIKDIPPIEQPQRFGNQAFRTWYDKLEEKMEELLKDVIPLKVHESIPEISVYLQGSFGHRTRIDYGTGHEMFFACFLCCLFKIGALSKDDTQAAVLKVFVRYVEVVRNLVITYRMEPAGSHGVWSLDDFHFLPFVWGSAQLIGNSKLPPNSFVDEKTVALNADGYMFMASIKFISEVKSGPFCEHSNQLWNISAIPEWLKVNSGLIKMYKAEVLQKFPVMQHNMFGSLLSIMPVTKQEGDSTGTTRS
ncbi:unnamed protein product [Darwinula stevensoni]|uniref:Serine/threonine-protein phosphatase 2A activator n=1 Tax=Darwinula stevensoni TaxID=69355 RepID=A0A7R9A391_9CRUS|nr:unnamed protein product [Darwinula stevensoni]CAG0880830.1 unnamed protein product [Darwinula stevensoni]